MFLVKKSSRFNIYRQDPSRFLSFQNLQDYAIFLEENTITITAS